MEDFSREDNAAFGESAGLEGQTMSQNPLLPPDQKARKSKHGKSLLALLIILGIIGGSVGAYFLFRPKPLVTVSFDTQGGPEVSAVQIKAGESIAAPSEPSQFGYTFAGWYYDKYPNKAWKEQDRFVADTTLYAYWNKQEVQSNEVSYIGELQGDPTIKVSADVELTEENIAEYLSFADLTRYSIPLKVQKEADYYLLTPSLPYDALGNYGILVLKPKQLRLLAVGDQELAQPNDGNFTFTVHRDNFSKIETRQEIISMPSALKAPTESKGKNEQGQDLYSIAVPDDGKTYQEGQIIQLAMDEGRSQNYKITQVEKAAGSTLLTLVIPRMEEVYSQYEYYVDAPVDLEPLKSEENRVKNEVSLQFEEGGASEKIIKMLAFNIRNNPTLRKALEDDSEALAELDAFDEHKLRNIMIANQMNEGSYPTQLSSLPAQLSSYSIGAPFRPVFSINEVEKEDGKKTS